MPVAIKITDQLPLFSNKVNEFYIDKFNPNNERFMFRVQVSISVYLISTWIIYFSAGVGILVFCIKCPNYADITFIY